MELPETGEQYSTEIGEGEAPTFAAETWSMQISEKQNKRQSDRIATKTRGGHTQEHSLCSAVQRRPTELCQNHPENHLRELSGTKTRGGKSKASAPKRRGRRVQGRVCSSTTSGAARCVHHGGKPSPDLPCCLSCQPAVQCVPHG